MLVRRNAAVRVVAGIGKNVTDAQGNGFLSRNTSEVYQKPLLLSATPTVRALQLQACRRVPSPNRLREAA
jgi:hypothetical protein